MRKIIFAVWTILCTLVSGVVAASAMAKPLDPAPVQFAVTGTFSAGPGEAGESLAGTVTIDRFVEQDEELAVQGTLAARDEGLFTPLAVTVFASARASDDDASGCTVDISTANAYIDPSCILVLAGASFALTESAEPDAARELCRVVQTATKDPADQSALARALNKVLTAH